MSALLNGDGIDRRRFLRCNGAGGHGSSVDGSGRCADVATAGPGEIGDKPANLMAA
jgi:hypothetical protein